MYQFINTINGRKMKLNSPSDNTLHTSSVYPIIQAIDFVFSGSSVY